MFVPVPFTGDSPTVWVGEGGAGAEHEQQIREIVDEHEASA